MPPADDQPLRSTEADVTASVDAVSGAAGGAPRAVGARLGRFVVVGELGRGGMGVVLAAYDPELDRKVAIKVLAPDARGGRRGRERMMREARALAKLAHPNVLAIHDVGAVGDDVFIATEFAAGGTLRAWCATPRTWREVRDAFVQAGRGLDAAHQAGLVHRDFKPENVLLTGAGRVCVADFGLVGHDDGAAGDGDDASASGSLTRTGAVLGTPAYMAPEQHAGDAVGPAADQFAFCAALWEALYGVRAFAGSSAVELAEAVLAGRVVAPPAARDVPAWLHAAVRRGLQTAPADRWPSMGALLAALEAEPGRPGRRRALVAGATAAVLGAALITYAATRSDGKAAAPCAGFEQRLTGVWDADRAAAMRAAFATSARPYAAATAGLVATALDDYARQWVDLRVATCEATHVRGEQSGELLDLKMACLDGRLAELGALADVFTGAGAADVVDSAVIAAAKLSPLAACADGAALRAVIPPPTDPAARAAVAAVRRTVAEAKARGDAGQYDAALPLAADAVTRARALGYPPALAEALHRRGVIEGFAGDADAADATLEEALLVAATAKDDALAASAWDDRLHVIGWMRGRPDEALRLRSVAEAAVRRAGDAPLAVARLDHVVGTVLVGAERPADAVPYLERAVAGKSASAGPDAIDVAVSLNSLAVAHMELGQYDLAEREYARVLATWERTLGPDHPHVAGVLNNLANLARDRGDEATAITRYTRSLAIRERAYGPDHPLVADSRDNLGISLGATGDLAGALREQTRALTIREQTLGPDHYDVSYSAMNLGSTYQALGRYADAEASYRRALRLAEQALGADSAELAYSLNGLAVALLSLARPAEALVVGERALALGGGTPDDVGELGNTRFVVARTLTALGRDRARALALARDAGAAFTAGGAAFARNRAEVDAWLATHAR